MGLNLVLSFVVLFFYNCNVNYDIIGYAPPLTFLCMLAWNFYIAISFVTLSWKATYLCLNLSLCVVVWVYV